MKDLVELGLWDDDMRFDIIYNKGSVQNIKRIPLEVRELYKTVWEISQKVLGNEIVTLTSRLSCNFLIIAVQGTN